MLTSKHQNASTARIVLENKIEAIASELNQLRLENSVLQRFNEKKARELGGDDDDKRKKKNKKNAATRLTIDQKSDIAHAIYDEIQHESESSRKNSEKMIDTLRAVLEETEIRIGELKRDAYEFKRDVVVGAENGRNGTIMAERVTRYFEDKIKQVDGVIEKLRLKNSTLKSQIHKIEHQLSQKEEVGDVLHYIDFHQLQIENKQHVAKIEERNEELIAVKMSTAKTIQVCCCCLLDSVAAVVDVDTVTHTLHCCDVQLFTRALHIYSLSWLSSSSIPPCMIHLIHNTQITHIKKSSTRYDTVFVSLNRLYIRR